MLAERFKLGVHREKREMNVLLMDLANRDGRMGPKIKQSEIMCDTAAAGANRLLFIAPGAAGEQTRCGILPADGPGRIIARGIDMPMLAAELAPSQRRTVIDRTGLSGRYDIDLTFTPEVFAAATLAQHGGTAPPGVDPNGPPLFLALRDQLGIKVESGRAPVEVVVIDRIEPLIED